MVVRVSPDSVAHIRVRYELRGSCSFGDSDNDDDDDDVDDDVDDDEDVDEDVVDDDGE